MPQVNANRLVLTGGHAATTAVAVVEEIRSEGKNWKLYWIGVRNAIEGKKIVTLESEALPRLGVKFLPLTTGRIQRRFTLWTIPSILKIPVGFVQSVYYLLKIKPKAVLSFGGFASFPVVVMAKFLRIPVIIHEQTSAAGRANIFSARFASKIALSRKESTVFFPNSKCEVVGNPVMSEIESVKPKLKLSNPPVIFITGGSRGSQSINFAVEKIIKKLLSKYKVIHQTGGLDYLKFSDICQKLPQALRDNYEVFIRVNPLDVAKIYAKTDIVVGRAGANTVSEIMTVKRPAILIPLSISFMDEQTRNARIAKKWGIAEIISQSNLSPEVLFKEIENLITHYSEIVNKVKSKDGPDKEASKKIVSLLSFYMK
ncbi:MAG: UDP-N-acetylglucosamine--N-acetylmuramyl-(pentapeptide) pyrophosphoryl-undecaprenol N-acetylglucosamine transferase [Candidatus Microgenomates bacterium]|jgi:UDP-N-acetylglucosamine--N-acetylmuramyl-(pentapeptide) pyrophosphoryl-undecaprenol N-acetylglucosamine transferase